MRTGTITIPPCVFTSQNTQSGHNLLITYDKTAVTAVSTGVRTNKAATAWMAKDGNKSHAVLTEPHRLVLGPGEVLQKPKTALRVVGTSVEYPPQPSRRR